MAGKEKKTGAGLARGQSKQDYATPEDFMAAVRARFGEIIFDLAADANNTKAPEYFDIETNSLQQDWAALCRDREGWLWLNPPFGNIAPWAAKCAEERAAGARILLLVPAAIGSNWFRDRVHQYADVLALNGRIAFDPEHPEWGYPKDCMLCVFNDSASFDVWDWKHQEL